MQIRLTHSEKSSSLSATVVLLVVRFSIVISSMETTLEELLSQKTPVLYKAGHVSIRQLAEKLRAAMKDASKGGKETKAVQYAYGLPFVKSLKLWVHAVSKCDALKPLVQPLTIVILSAIRAKESHLIFTPYVSILLGLLNDLSLNCRVFIPMVSSCLTTLTLCANKLSSKSLTAEGREPNISDVVRVSERQLKDRRVVRGLTIQLVRELTRHMAFIARTGALPELGWIVVQGLRKITKTNPSLKQELSGLVNAIEESIKEIKEKRKSVTDDLFQFEFEDSSVGRLWVKLEQQKHTEPVHHQHVEEDEDPESEAESDSSSEPETKKHKKSADEEERSKRSLKRQRQKEKKRLERLSRSVDAVAPEQIVSEVEAKIEEMEEIIVPFEFSDSENDE
jgi:nucleolar complex protein 2